MVLVLFCGQESQWITDPNFTREAISTEASVYWRNGCRPSILTGGLDCIICTHAVSCRKNNDTVMLKNDLHTLLAEMSCLNSLWTSQDS